MNSIAGLVDAHSCIIFAVGHGELAPEEANAMSPLILSGIKSVRIAENNQKRINTSIANELAVLRMTASSVADDDGQKDQESWYRISISDAS